MGRVRGKGKKQIVMARENPGSGEEEKITTQRKRGRPQKIVKDRTTEEDSVNKDEENGEGLKDGKDIKNELITENGRKRVRSAQAKENIDSVKEENGIGAKLNTNDVVKPVGFRQNGSRRKNKPRRAAEVGVECK